MLDYGCGAGELVALMRSRGVNASGCDVFFDGGDFSNLMEAARPYISRMTDGRIPFADESFDVLVSNQVIEHVPDLDLVVRETARVLKPGGICIHLFPDRSVWFEGHASIPFLHWFGKGTRGRVYYAVAMHSLGFGLPLRGMTRLDRYRGKCLWLDQWTHYRSMAELHESFAKSFSIAHVEDRWFDARFGSIHAPRFLKRWVVRKLAGTAMVLRKH